MTECCTVQVSPSHNDQTTRTEQQNHHQVHVRSPFSEKSKKLPNFFIETILSSDSELPRFSEKLDFENTRVASQAKIFNTDVSAINYSDKNPIRWREACWSAYQEPHPRSYFCQEIARLTLQFQANNSVYRPIPIDQIYAVVTSRNHPESDRPPDFGPSERPAGLSNCNASRSNEVSAAEIVRGQLSSKNSASDTSLSQKKLFDKERVLSSNARVENDSEARKESSTKNKTDPSTTPTDETTKPKVWPAWVYCTRYSDRPSAGPRTRRVKRKEKHGALWKNDREDRRARVAFTMEQLQRLQAEFGINQYLTEERRVRLANELGLTVTQIKVWFQNKRAKVKKSSGVPNALALQLLAEGLYNHCSQPTKTSDDEEKQE